MYLRGISTGDFQETLAALLGKDAPNLSPAVVARLTATWADEYARWQARDLSARRYVYVWADGVYLQARMEDQAECILTVLQRNGRGVRAHAETRLRASLPRARRQGGAASVAALVGALQ